MSNSNFIDLSSADNNIYSNSANDKKRSQSTVYYDMSADDDVIIIPANSSCCFPSSSSSSSFKRPRIPLEEILDIFPRAAAVYVNTMLQKFGGNVELVVQDMAEKGFEKEKSADSKAASNSVDFSSTSWETSQSYRRCALNALYKDFPFLRKTSVNKTFEKHKFHYFAAVAWLEKTLNIRARQVVRPLPATLLAELKVVLARESLAIKHPVAAVEPSILELDPIFEEEYLWVNTRKRRESEAQDRLIAEQLNSEIAASEGSLIECGCCCSENPFEANVQCTEGHLFCKQCLQRYAEQTVFGDGRSALKCMTSEGDGCPGFFSDETLRLTLSEKVFEKYQEANARDAIKAACVANLVTCFSCSFRVELSEDAGCLLHCPACGEDTCRLCGEKGHVPLKCSEVEKKGQTEVRLTVEEAMTNARLRQCPKCKARFFKTEGCNKMTCACGAYMCYLCRKDVSKEMYRHFCQTPHCDHSSCRRCVLFSDAVEDDRRAMYEAGLRAMSSAATTAVASSQSGAAAPTVEIGKLLEGGVLVAGKKSTVRPNPGPAGPGMMPVVRRGVHGVPARVQQHQAAFLAAVAQLERQRAIVPQPQIARGEEGQDVGRRARKRTRA